MKLSEKELYHQIHPLKLTVDAASTLLSLPLLWQHNLNLGLVIHFLPPLLATIFVMGFSDLEKQKQSSLGKYVLGHMGTLMQILRVAGDVILIGGAWYHDFGLLVFGVLIIAIAWLNGLLIPTRFLFRKAS